MCVLVICESVRAHFRSVPVDDIFFSLTLNDSGIASVKAVIFKFFIGCAGNSVVTIDPRT